MWDDEELYQTIQTDEYLSDGLHFAHDGYELVNYDLCKWFEALENTEYAGYGYVNSDSEINILDLIAMKKLVANSEADYKPSADVTKDGAVINADDLIQMRKYLLGIITEF